MNDVSTRFWAKVEKTPECWLWTGHLTHNGYGRFTPHFKAAPQVAHRFAYMNLVGPIPDGLVLDHLCRTRNCVRPDHLEPVTDWENKRRGIGPTAENARKTSCNNGHEFDAENTYIYDGDNHRRCRACHRERCAQYRAKKRAQRKTLSE